MREIALLLAGVDGIFADFDLDLEDFFGSLRTSNYLRFRR